MKPQPQHEDEHLDLDSLREELHCLARRVDALEHREPHEHATRPAPDLAAVPAGLGYALPTAPNAIPAAGRAVLGLAGAYLLRALAESGAAPMLVVVLAAILYAVTWLVFSVRTSQPDTFGSTVYGITAALILAPLLWEATLRFGILPPLATAGILVTFLVLSYALAWSRTSDAVTIVTTLATLLTAVVLMVQTGDLVPFAAAILAIACLVEASAARGHARNMRVPAAIAADFAVWLIYFVVTRPNGVPEHYRPVSETTCLALGALLLLVYVVSVVWQAVVPRQAVAVGYILQVIAAFALAAGGALVITQGRSTASVGGLCAIAGAAAYFVAFLRFGDSEHRNHYLFASWAAALSLIACALILPANQLTLIWSAAAVLAMVAGIRNCKVTLRVHGALYLVAAGLTMGFPATILNAFAGTTLGSASAALWIMAVSTPLCYATCFFGKSGPITVNVVLALLSAVWMGALSILAVVPFIGGNPTPSFLATARTLIICVLAAVSGFIGSRTGHRELIWVSYAVIALGAVKLVMEDFQQSRPEALAASLVCYGAVLILVPKLSAGMRQI